jgi:hypothetical protein
MEGFRNIFNIFFKKIYPLDFDRDELINEQLPLSMNLNSTVSPCTEVDNYYYSHHRRIRTYFLGIIAN